MIRHLNVSNSRLSLPTDGRKNQYHQILWGNILYLFRVDDFSFLKYLVSLFVNFYKIASSVEALDMCIIINEKVVYKVLLVNPF